MDWLKLLTGLIAQKGAARTDALRLKAELWMLVLVSLGTAVGFVTLGAYLWLWSSIGAIAAAFLMAGVFLLVGLAGLFLLEREKKRPPPPEPDLAPLIAALTGFVDGLTGQDSAEKRR